MGVVATIEDTDITLLWGDNRAFIGRVTEYGVRTGARYGFVVPMKGNVPYETIMEGSE